MMETTPDAKRGCCLSVVARNKKKLGASNGYTMAALELKDHQNAAIARVFDHDANCARKHGGFFKIDGTLNPAMALPGHGVPLSQGDERCRGFFGWSPQFRMEVVTWFARFSLSHYSPHWRSPPALRAAPARQACRAARIS